MREPLARWCYPKVVEQRGSGGMRRVRGVTPEAVEDVEDPSFVLKGDLATVGRGAKATGTLGVEAEMLRPPHDATQHALP